MGAGASATFDVESGAIGVRAACSAGAATGAVDAIGSLRGTDGAV
jgi:hypothetical protein